MSVDPEQVHCVRAIISRMEPPVREVFLLSRLADRRNDEIAEFLGISISAPRRIREDCEGPPSVVDV